MSVLGSDSEPVIRSESKPLLELIATECHGKVHFFVVQCSASMSSSDQESCNFLNPEYHASMLNRVANFLHSCKISNPPPPMTQMNYHLSFFGLCAFFFRLVSAM